MTSTVSRMLPLIAATVIAAGGVAFVARAGGLRPTDEQTPGVNVQPEIDSGSAAAAPPAQPEVQPEVPAENVQANTDNVNSLPPEPRIIEAVEAAELQTELRGQPEQAVPENVAGWNPPALEVPIARHPFDHYWFIRPVSASYKNFGLFYYPYGSDGPANDLRIHHGIDIANPIGVEVFAAGDGVVIWADKGHFNEYESITSYGNTVVIKHDFGYDGQSLYTLYAHLSVILVGEGETVEAGDVIGLTGNTGLVSGPHVHFEVRVGRNSYFTVRNPELWIAPYSGTGVVAGRIETTSTENPDEPQPLYDLDVALINAETGSTTHRTTTYTGTTALPDDNWNENFVFADVPQGRYQAVARYGGQTWQGRLNVMQGQTNWVDMKVEDAPEPTGTP